MSNRLRKKEESSSSERGEQVIDRLLVELDFM